MIADYPELEIGGQTVAAFAPLFVIAEIGLNHGGSIERALQLIDAAADAGATAVKFQTLEAAALVAPGAPAPAHVRVNSMSEFFAQFELDELAHERMIERARARGLAVMATPFSEAAVDMLARLGIDAFKIASGDLTWKELIVRCARTRKPLVMSTGMSGLGEASSALGWARSAGATGVALLHCVSSYPVPPGHENLRAITALSDAFGIPVGLSDHAADGSSLPLAVALGAAIYERHLVLRADDGSIDAAVSSTPEQLADLVRTAARARAALGSGQKVCLPAERGNKLGSRRALYSTRALAAGHVITKADLIALRPGIGIPAERQDELVGTMLSRDMEAGMAFVDLDLAPAFARPSTFANATARQALEVERVA
jgi:N,N'-diacetyllegionaminate synthase